MDPLSILLTILLAFAAIVVLHAATQAVTQRRRGFQSSDLAEWTALQRESKRLLEDSVAGQRDSKRLLEEWVSLQKEANRLLAQLAEAKVRQAQGG